MTGMPDSAYHIAPLRPATLTAKPCRFEVPRLMVCRILSGLLCFLFAGPLLADPEANRWIEKMGNALRFENYQGVFTYMRGSTHETVRIAHRFEDGKEVESLFNLNGEAREIRRQDNEIICYHPGAANASEDILQHGPLHIGPFAPLFAERVSTASHLYRTSMHGEDRVAGRTAVKIAVAPSHHDRYGYHLWLDKESGLLLRSHLIDRGRVKEIFQFANIGIGQIQDSALAVITGKTVSHPLTMFEPQERQERPVWRVSWLPNGFRPVRVQGNQLHFSDGLATVSVFVEQQGKPLPEMTTTVGGTVVTTRRLQQTGSQITVVGEVPVQTAKRVAESVEPALF